MWDVMCNVSKITVDIDNYCGQMWMPADNCPDMSSTIKHFKRIDKHINTIFTYIDDVPDVIYVIIHGKWEARYPQDHKRNRHAVHQESATLQT